MPTVRRYGPRQVAPAPIADTRRQSADTPESLGADLFRQQTRTREAVADVARQGAVIGARMYEELRAKAVQQADRDVDLKTDNQLATIHADLEQQVLQTKGDQVLGLRTRVLEDWKKQRDEIGAKLTTPDQKYNFERRSAQREQQLDMTILRHTDDQLETSRQADAKIRIDNARAAIRVNALDPRRVGEELARAEEVVRSEGARLGWSDERTQAAIAETQSVLHTDHIEALLGAGKPTLAQAAWDESQEFITGSNRASLQKAVEAGTTLGEAQRVADTITIAGGENDSLTDWREKAKARNLSPEVREKVLDLLNEADAVRQRDRRETEAAQSRSLANWIDTTPSASLASLELRPEWRAADPGTRSGMIAYLDHKIRGSKPETDLRVWTTLADLRRDDPGAFAVKDLTPYLGKLSETDYQQFKDQQTSLVAGGARAASVVRTVSIDDNLFKTIATSAGVNVYPPDSDLTGHERVDTLRYNVEQAIGDAQVKTKRELTYEEKKTVMTGVLDAHVWLNKWGTDPELPAAAVVNAERDTAYVPITRIPKVTITEFSNYVRSVSPITAKWDQAQILSEYEDRFQRAYAALVMRLGDAEVRRRLEGR